MQTSCLNYFWVIQNKKASQIITKYNFDNIPNLVFMLNCIFSNINFLVFYLQFCGIGTLSVWVRAISIPSDTAKLWIIYSELSVESIEPKNSFGARFLKLVELSIITWVDWMYVGGIPSLFAQVLFNTISIVSLCLIGFTRIKVIILWKSNLKVKLYLLNVTSFYLLVIIIKIDC